MKVEPIFYAGMIFLVIIVSFYLADQLVRGWKREKELLNRTRKWTAREEADKGGLPGGTGDSEQGGGGNSFLVFLGLAGKKKSGPESIYVETPLVYQRAGIYDATRLRSFEGLRYFLLALPFLVLIVNHYAFQRQFNAQLFIFALPLAYLGYNLPIILLKKRASSRQKMLDRTFPDAIDLLMVCVEAGMGLDAAIRRVSGEIHVTSPELAKEFRILSLELKSGKSRNSCLKNLAQRTGLPEIENLVSLLIQADRYGTGIANALKIHSEEMRQKRYARLEETAAKLPVKLVLPLIFCIFPALFVIIIGPGAIQIFRVIILR